MKEYNGDISHNLNTLGDIEHFTLKFNKFELFQLNHEDAEKPHQGKWYIIGVGEPIEESSAKIYSNPNVLNSLVNLGSKIVSGNGLYTEDSKRDELSFYKEIEDWCKEYGLPHFHHHLLDRYSGVNHFGIALWIFKRVAVRLYNCFNLWYGLTYNDFKRVMQYAKEYNLTFDTTKDLDKQIIDAKKFIADHLSGGMNIGIRLKYNENTDKYETIPSTSSIFSVAWFQLAMLTTSNGTSNVRFCSMCNKLFTIEHANKKICDVCQRDYHRIKMQESRKRKKLK